MFPRFLIRRPDFIVELYNHRPLSSLAYQMHTGRKVMENQVRIVIETAGQPHETFILKPDVSEVLAHHAPVAFFDPGAAFLFVGA